MRAQAWELVLAEENLGIAQEEATNARQAVDQARAELTQALERSKRREAELLSAGAALRALRVARAA